MLTLRRLDPLFGPVLADGTAGPPPSSRAHDPRTDVEVAAPAAASDAQDVFGSGRALRDRWHRAVGPQSLRLPLAPSRVF